MSEPPRIALATCAPLPEGDGDEAALPAALGPSVAADFVPWDDPAADWARYDLVVVRATWNYQAQREAYLGWARALGDRVLNPAPVLTWNTDKRHLDELAGAGLPVVPTRFVAPGEPFVAPTGAYVVKPTVSAGSRDTARFVTGEHERAAALVAAIHGGGRTAMVQPYVASVDARGETAMVFFDGRFSHAIHKGPLLRPGAAPSSEVFVPETIEPRAASPAELAVAERVTAWAARRFDGPLLYARVDLVTDAAGAPLVLELELTEPSLFLTQADGAVQRFAAAILARVPKR